MNKLLFSGLAIFVLALSGCVQNSTPEGNITDTLPGGGTTAGMLILGAACEQDSDCVYAINAYPLQKCISANCPPPEAEQPAPGDPAYEWKQTYLDECVNASALSGKNVQGEDLLVDERAATCACQTIQSQGGVITSLDGQKICRKQIVEETTNEEVTVTQAPAENPPVIVETTPPLVETAPVIIPCTITDQDYRYYFDQKQFLDVATNRFVLGFSSPSDNADIKEVMDGAGYPDYSKYTILEGTLFLIEMPACMTFEKLEEAIQKINSVTETQLDFVGKAYNNENEEFAGAETDTLLVKRKGTATSFENYLETKGIDIVETNFGAMEGTYLLKANSRITGISPQETANKIYEDGKAEWSEVNAVGMGTGSGSGGGA